MRLAWSQPLSAWLAHWLADMCDLLSFIFLSYSLIEMFCVMCSMTLIKHLDVLHLLCFSNLSHITSAPLSMSDINVQQFGVINTLSAADDVGVLREENVLPSVDWISWLKTQLQFLFPVNSRVPVVNSLYHVQPWEWLARWADGRAGNHISCFLFLMSSSEVFSLSVTGLPETPTDKHWVLW